MVEREPGEHPEQSGRCLPGRKMVETTWPMRAQGVSTANAEQRIRTRRRWGPKDDACPCNPREIEMLQYYPATIKITQLCEMVLHYVYVSMTQSKSEGLLATNFIG
eukprot:scaffold1347_cov350-Pavlova_lutheri.AAC.58